MIQIKAAQRLAAANIDHQLLESLLKKVGVDTGPKGMGSKDGEWLDEAQVKAVRSTMRAKNVKSEAMNSNGRRAIKFFTGNEDQGAAVLEFFPKHDAWFIRWA